MKKLLLALLLLVPASARAITYQSVRASTATILTPTIQTGTMNLSSGTITNLTDTNVTAQFMTVNSTASFVGVTGSTISYSSATFTNVNATGISGSTITYSSATFTSANILAGTFAGTVTGGVTGTVTGPVSNAAAGYVLTSTVTASSATITAGTVTTLTGTTATISTATVTTLINAVMRYRRPVLQYNTGSIVNLESGITGTSGQSPILFPDGSYYTESTAAGIQCDLTKRANYGSSLQAGLTPGFVLTNNTLYSFYAVKSTSTSTDFAVVATSVAPTQANFATLNTAYGTNGWAYLGNLPYGDNAGTANAIPKFAMNGNRVSFYNTGAGAASTLSIHGIRLATGNGVSSLTWTYATGTTVGTNVPATVTIGDVTASMQAGGTLLQIQDGSGNSNWITLSPAAGQAPCATVSNVPFALGLKQVASGTVNQDMWLSSYIDSALGVGSNPQL